MKNPAEIFLLSNTISRDPTQMAVAQGHKPQVYGWSVNHSELTFHMRHNGLADVVYSDGHVDPTDKTEYVTRANDMLLYRKSDGTYPAWNHIYYAIGTGDDSAWVQVK
jgi:prepilin-type processing-associated H-X9-DG protein